MLTVSIMSPFNGSHYIYLFIYLKIYYSEPNNMQDYT